MRWPAATDLPDTRKSSGSLPRDSGDSAPQPDPQPGLRLGRADSCCAPARGAAGEERIGAGWLVFLLMPLCCGGPLLIGAIAAAGAVAWGVAGGVVAIVVAGALVLVVRRRARLHCQSIEGRQAASHSGSGALR